MQSFLNADVRAVCKGLGPQLQGVPNGLDPARVMLAIAAVESGGADPNFAGHDCMPRHEPAYDRGGSFFLKSPTQQILIQKYGSGAAYSYGPWQMMFCNFPPGTEPAQLVDLNNLALSFVRWWNIRVRVQAPMNIAQVGEIWNAGRKVADPDYEAKITKAYAATEETQK